MFGAGGNKPVCQTGDSGRECQEEIGWGRDRDRKGLQAIGLEKVCVIYASMPETVISIIHSAQKD